MNEKKNVLEFLIVDYILTLRVEKQLSRYKTHRTYKFYTTRTISHRQIKKELQDITENCKTL